MVNSKEPGELVVVSGEYQAVYEAGDIPVNNNTKSLKAGTTAPPTPGPNQKWVYVGK